jgi:hypothetical protein
MIYKPGRCGMTEDRTWRIWVCPACWGQLGLMGDRDHEINREGEWICHEEGVEIDPVQIEVTRRLVTAL